MNYPYFGQTGQGATSVPPSNQPTNVQQVAPPQQNPQFLMNNQQFQGNQMGQPLFPQPTGSVYNLNTASDIGNVPAGVAWMVQICTSMVEAAIVMAGTAKECMMDLKN